MQKTIKVRGILPPGIQKNSNVVFGIMWIKLGKITLSNQPINKNITVLIQFWGQKLPIKLQPQNIPTPQYNKLHEYQIRCPVLNFQKYLLDMKNNLKIEVESQGNVYIDFKSLLTKNASQTSKSAFDHFKSKFNIQKKNKIVGTLQIEMAANFNPKIVEVEMEEKGLQCKNAIQIIAAQKPWILQQFLQDYEKKQKPNLSLEDKRIPNSLNTKEVLQEKFNPKNYEQQISGNKNANLKNDLKQLSEIKANIITVSKSPSQANQKKITELPKQFPTLEKILTYSNLKLHNENQEGSQYQQLKKSNNDQQQQYDDHISNKSGKQSILEYQLRAKQQQMKKELQLKKQFYGLNTQNFHQQSDIIKQSQPKSQNQQIKNIQVLPSSKIQKQQLLIQPPPSAKFAKPDKTQQFRLDNENKRYPILNPPPPFKINQQYIPKPIINRMPVESNISENRLLLSLYIEISNILIDTPTFFHLIYKVYGQSQRTRLQYNPEQPLIIMSPIGIAQLKKMDKIPFIIQIWDTKKNTFLGMIKIQLVKIKQAYLIGDRRMNQKAIKANIMPTIIVKGRTDIINLKKNIVGSSELHVMIGTGNQINIYLNQKSKPNVNSPIKQQEKKEIKQNNQVIRQADTTLNLIELLTDFLFFLKCNHTKIIEELLKLISSKELTLLTFTTFLNKINKISFLPLYNLFDYKKRGLFSVQLISDSFEQFNKLEQTLRGQYIERIKILKQMITEDVLKTIEANSQFNLITRQKFIRILIEYSKKSQTEIQSIIKFYHQEYISTTKLKKQLMNSSNFSDIKFDNPIVRDQILIDFKNCIKNHQIDSSDIVTQFNQNARIVHIEQIGKIFKRFGEDISLWKILMLSDTLKIKYSQITPNIFEITYITFYNWFSSVREKIEIEQKENQKLKLKQLEQEKQRIKQINEEKNKKIPELIITSNNNSLNINHQTSSPNHKNQIEEKQISNLNSLVKEALQNHSIQQNPNQKHQQNKSIHQQQQPNLKNYKHIFTIEVTQLNLQKPRTGNSFISYTFPHQQDHIQSKEIHVFADKYKYDVKMIGKHSFVLDTNIENYIGQQLLKFKVQIDQIICCQGALPSQQFLIEEGTEIKVLALFSLQDQEPQIVGKIKIRLSYKKEQTTTQFIGKQTIMNMYLAKTGFLNIQITSAIDIKKLATQMRLKDEFYCSIVFDPFYENKQLQQVIKPVHSKLHANISQVIYLRDCIKIKLNNQMIQYFKSKMCKILLQAVYYQRLEGIPKKHEITLGSIQIPMLSIISGRGIIGDYAFKNKYGIFVALAQCKINYGKQKIQVAKPEQPILQLKKANEKIWIILNFLQIINFYQIFKYISFEVSSKKEKSSTTRIHLTGQSLNLLKNSYICLQMTTEQFYEMTFLSVNIKTNSKEKLFLDINTRPIINSLQKHKHTVFSNYFTIVGQDEQLKKIRIGAKIIGFRGSNMTQKFVNKIIKNVNVDIFEQLQIPSELDNYNKMLDLYQKQLKISKNEFEEYLNDILINKQRLNIQLFTTAINFRLDFTQIKSNNFQSIIKLIQQSPNTEIPAQDLIQILDREDIYLLNFKEEFLNRFTFKELDFHILDRNAELFHLSDLVDLIVFVRKIKVTDKKDSISKQNYDSINNEVSMNNLNIFKIQIESGKDFQSLYNGIKPNSMIRCSTLDIQTNVVNRNSNPQFNYNYQIKIDNSDLSNFRKLEFEVYHKHSLEQQNTEEMLIGKGKIDISTLLFHKGDKKTSTFNIALTPQISYIKTIKANLRIICQIQKGVSYQPDKSKKSSKIYEQQSEESEIEESNFDKQKSSVYDISRIANIIKQEKIKIGKQMLFESSDDDY